MNWRVIRWALAGIAVVTEVTAFICGGDTSTRHSRRLDLLPAIRRPGSAPGLRRFVEWAPSQAS